MKKILLITGLFCFSTPAFSNDTISEQNFETRYSTAAVSGINGKISFGASFVDNGLPDRSVFSTPDSIDPSNALTFDFPNQNEFLGGFVEGSISLPVGERFGFQIDGLYSRQSSNLDLDSNIFGIGGHLFWRDPQKGLLGIYGQFVDYDFGLSNYQIGAEAEIYRENISLELFAGVDGVELDFGPLTVKNNLNGFAGEAVLAYYPDENFRVSGGIAHNFEETRFITGLEWQFSNTKSATSVFVDAEFGEDVTAVRAGVSLYFTQQNKSLILRHREDDPQSRLLNNYAILQGCPGKFIDKSSLSTTPTGLNPLTGQPTTLDFEPSLGQNSCEVNQTPFMDSSYDPDFNNPID